eukprot:gene655-371_t
MRITRKKNLLSFNFQIFFFSNNFYLIFYLPNEKLCTTIITQIFLSDVNIELLEYLFGKVK